MGISARFEKIKILAILAFRLIRGIIPAMPRKADSPLRPVARAHRAAIIYLTERGGNE
jgi:hypothetical protein